MPLQVELVSADRKVWSGEASLVIVRTVDGGFLSVEHDRVTLVSDTAAVTAGSTVH